MQTIRFGDRPVGDGHPCYILAEAGCNHNQQLELALKLIDIAKEAGADGVKFQTYRAENIYSKQSPMIEHVRKRIHAPEDATMFDLIKMTELPWEMHTPVVEHCRARGIEFLSTPFDFEAVDLLEAFNVPAYKIASFEMTHYPLLRRVARTGKPVILSTGMSSLGDIEKVLTVLHAEGNDQVVLLHCVSNYPARPEDYNLRVIHTLKTAFGYPVGLSDHTQGIDATKIGLAMGANLIEKHITMDQSLPGPDHYFSLTPGELSALVKARDEIEAMLGSPVKHCTPGEASMKELARRSMVAAVPIAKGATITAEMIAVKRPGSGLHPELFDVLVGSVAQRDIAEDTPLQWDMVIAYDRA